MKSIQFIERDGKPEYAVVPMYLFERIAPMLADIDDQALYDLAKSGDDGFRVPAAVVQAIIGGTHPVKAWREYRQSTQESVAESAGISKAYLSQIETGKRHGAMKTLRAIAGALGVTLDDLQDS